MRVYTSALKYADSFLAAGRLIGEWNQAGRPEPVPDEVEQAAKTMAEFYGDEDPTRWLAPPQPSRCNGASEFFESVYAELRRMQRLDLQPTRQV